ncbi:LEC14B protein [Cytospora mali]|uniref:LEC14B protein n=1 Tax=Cytospora mali TaxID=578113 RepID=A0A194W9P5_CYTMA|nr:LEC14B protein [Valsa mali]
MSYRYPHQDDSDENGFGETMQQSSGAQPPDSSDSDSDVFEPASEHSTPAPHGTADDNDDEDENESNFEEPGEEAEDDDEEEEDDDDDDEFHDAEAGFTVEVVYDESGGNEGEDDDGTQRVGGEERPTTMGGIFGRIGATHLTAQQLLALFHSRDIGHVLFNDFEGPYGSDEWSFRRRRRNPPDPNRFPKVPSDKGTELMNSGAFGSTDRTAIRQQKKLARRILDRELGVGNQRVNQDAMAQDMIPTSDADMIVHYRAPVYCGQFSEDGNFFYACVKDFKVRMYDTSNPYNWRYYKTVNYPWGQWTLTDAHLSPDNKWLAYTSLQSHVCFAPTDPNDKGDPYTLDLGSGSRDTGWGGWRSRGHFAIWSIRFSGDGRELIAGNNDSSIIVYDIESRRVLHNIRGHDDDVNAVCFADPKDPHIIYSGSDDQVIKVWDRRSMGDGREAGAFVGHIEGLTYIDSKGDGRYLLSNGKDQTMKLWDLRMAMSTERYEALNPRQHTSDADYDYRVEDYDMDNWFPHPNDNSVVTFRGHKVQGTLIRCHFSPPGSTNSRYVYSGSQDGKIYVWNMDATLKTTIDVSKATRKAGRNAGREGRFRRAHPEVWGGCVREPYWHPNAPIIAASSWGGYDMSSGSVSVHSWNENVEDDVDDPEMGWRVNDHLAAHNFNME